MLFCFQEVSVLLFEKKAIDNYDKKEKEIILEMFRKGPQQLAKLRHPRLLTVQQTLEESRYDQQFLTDFKLFSNDHNISFSCRLVCCKGKLQNRIACATEIKRGML